MRIALLSHCFYPSIGGIETMGELLADGFTKAGHEVVVVTQTEDPGTRTFAYEVVRRPGPRRLLGIARWCDVYFQNNISLQTLWPLLFLSRPLVITLATWIARPDGSLSWRDQLKRSVLKYAACVANSQSVARSVPVPATVIGNPYQSDLFRVDPGVERDRDLVFLGRLVSDKGPHLLLDAIQQLDRWGLNPSALFIGSGDQLEGLRARVQQMSLPQTIEFAGSRRGAELVRLLNRCRIMVVPSVWNEPFGIVALEGAACGCVVVGSSGGGLADAIGPCGPTFASGNAEALAATLRRLLESPDEMQRYRENAPQHLQQHTVEAVTARYLDVIKRAARSGKARARDSRT